MWSIPTHKIHGPDGFESGFYRKAWEIIRTHVVASVHKFFSTRKLHQNLNATHLTLIPYCDEPSTVTEFMPISLCGVTYKVIAKILSNKLQAILLCLANDSQAAFVNGQNILHNVLIGVELVRLYKRSNVSLELS